MKVRYPIVLLFLSVFFFGDIAISLSDKASSGSYPAQGDISFALNLNNRDSESKETEHIDEMFESFLKKYKLAGASVAVSQHGKIVYARGFGYANTEMQEEVQPGHLFRIASVSKLITAVAIMKLADTGELKLEDHVFGENGILNDSCYLAFSDERYRDITVHHLLNHTSGLAGTSGDPIFNAHRLVSEYQLKRAVGIQDVIMDEMKNRLRSTPGVRYRYSNLGYTVLGEIIRKKSGKSYEDYVQDQIMKPLGLYDFHLGRSLYYQKFPNEARYYEPAGSPLIPAFDGSGRMVPRSYGGNNMELLGAAGGWIASAPELLRFISAIDRQPGVSDILSDSLLQLMSDPTVSGPGLYGWRGTDQRSVWRTGTLSGTAAFVISMDNGLNWVILLNSSSTKWSRIHNILYHNIQIAMANTPSWPQNDLFLLGLNRFNSHNAPLISRNE